MISFKSFTFALVFACHENDKSCYMERRPKHVSAMHVRVACHRSGGLYVQWRHEVNFR